MSQQCPKCLSAAIFKIKWFVATIFIVSLLACNSNSDESSASSASAPKSTSVSVSAGSNKVLTLPETRTDLTGSASGATVVWSQLSGPAPVVFKSTTTALTSVMADQPGVYVLQLTARDTTGNIKTSQVTVSVKPNLAALNAGTTPLDHLKLIPKPAFKLGHTLLPLSRSSCAVSEAIGIELMKSWGFSAQFGDIGGPIGQEVLAAPGRYPIEVSFASFYGLYDNFDGVRPDLPVLPASAYLRDASGAFIMDGQRRIPSPAAPDAVLTIIGEFAGKRAAQVEKLLGQPIRLITNSGEYGLSNFNEAGPSTFYEKDPIVVAAHKVSGLDWYQYNGREKARHEKLIKDAILKSLQKSIPVYSAYTEQYGTERGRWFGWKQYISLYEFFIGENGKPLVSDYSAPESYFNFHNSGWSGVHANSMVPNDALTQALKNIGGAIKLKQRNVYPWVSMGWDRGDSGGVSESDLFMGMMKSYYTAGALGAVSGYFTCEGAEFQAMARNDAVGPVVPTQIKGMYLLGEIHALFSHLEEYLREGDLLPGTGSHPFTSGGEEETPAMEFAAVGETTQIAGTFGPITIPTARVLARKIKGQNRWLISAWANTGKDRDVFVTIDPKLGKMNLQARRSGAIYLAEIKNGVTSLRLVDKDGMSPTRTLFP